MANSLELNVLIATLTSLSHRRATTEISLIPRDRLMAFSDSQDPIEVMSPPGEIHRTNRETKSIPTGGWAEIILSFSVRRHFDDRKDTLAEMTEVP